MIRFFLLSILLCLPFSSLQATERILALSPQACEMLAGIGALDEIVGVVEYCDYPEALRLRPQIGGYGKVRVEAALALRPTLAVVMDGEGRVARRLNRMGVRVVASNPRRLEAMFRELHRLGELTGHTQEALALVQRLRERLETLGRVKPAGSLSVFYEIWPQPLMTAGSGSLIHDVLTRIGLRNAFGDLPQEGVRVNVEAVIRAAPDIVIIADANRLPERRAFWRKWLGDGVKVVVVDADLLHRASPRLIDGMAMLLERVTQ